MLKNETQQELTRKKENERGILNKRQRKRKIAKTQRKI